MSRAFEEEMDFKILLFSYLVPLDRRSKEKGTLDFCKITILS